MPHNQQAVEQTNEIVGTTNRSIAATELEEFSMDPRRSPQRIGNAYLADKLAYLRRYSWSAADAGRLTFERRPRWDACAVLFLNRPLP
jgi:hypothetical protein